MIRGVVQAGEALVDFALRNADGTSTSITAAIDTGYNGHLLLSEHLVQDLRLPRIGTSLATLADGRNVELKLYAATVLWGDTEYEIPVSSAQNAPLIGMALLAGQHLGIDVVDNGPVTIAPLT